MSGLPGSGKTLVLTAIGFNEYLLGRRIFSNYHLEYPHTYVSSKEDLYAMSNGLFLGDELWRWLFSRRAMRRDQQEIIEDFVENIRKRGIDMIYTGHADFTIDKIVRTITGYYMQPSLVPLRVPDKNVIKEVVGGNGESEDVYGLIWKALRSPENYGVVVRTYDVYDNLLNETQFNNLRFWGNMYNTFKEVGGLSSESKRKRKGVALEEKCYEAISGYGLKDVSYLIPNSGYGSPYPGDLIVGNNLIDVKGIDLSGSVPRIDVRSAHWNKYFSCTRDFGLSPWFGFCDKKWFFTPINADMPFIKNKSSIAVNVLMEYAISLKAFCTQIVREKAKNA